MKIETIEVAGLASALKAMRLPYNKDSKSIIYTDSWCDDSIENDYAKEYLSQSDIFVHPKDVELFQNLMESGDSHAKMQRGLLAYLDITASISFWSEAETHRMGHERLFSSSTMNTEGKKLKGLALEKELKNVSIMRPIRKIDYFSYQCLRNIVKQRHNHRKPEWHAFIEHIKTLPLADEFILYGLEHELEIHDMLWDEYLEELKEEELKNKANNENTQES